MDGEGRLVVIQPADRPIFTFKKGEYVDDHAEKRCRARAPVRSARQFFEIVDDVAPFTSQPGLKETGQVPGNRAYPATSASSGSLIHLSHLRACRTGGTGTGRVFRPRLISGHSQRCLPTLSRPSR